MKARNAFTAMALATAVPAGAQAGLITFESVAGTTSFNQAFEHTSEQGFDISRTLGTWKVNTGFGAPGPSIYATKDSPASILVTHSAGGLFAFGGLALAASDAITYSITGLLDNSVQFLMTGTDLQDFSSPLPSSSTTLIDALTIELELGQASSVNVDSISVTAVNVAEPGSLALFSLGLISLGLARRKRSR